MPHLNETFHIELEGSKRVEVELIKVRELGAGRSEEGETPPRRKPFSILFRGPRDTVLPQKIYRFTHSQMAPFDLFIVPIGPDQSGMIYEAILN